MTASVVSEVYVNAPQDRTARLSSQAFAGSFTLYRVRSDDMLGYQMTSNLSFDIPQARSVTGGVSDRIGVTIVPRPVSASVSLPDGRLATIVQLLISVEGEIGGATNRKKSSMQRRAPVRAEPQQRHKT